MLVVLLFLIIFGGFYPAFSDLEDEIPQVVREKVKALFQREPQDKHCILPFQDRLIHGKLYSSVPNNPYPYKQYQVVWPICRDIVYGHTLPEANEISGDNPDVKVGLVNILIDADVPGNYYIMMWQRLPAGNTSKASLYMNEYFLFDVQLTSDYSHWEINVPPDIDKKVHNIEIRTSQFENQLFFVLWVVSVEQRNLLFEKRTVQWDFPTPLTRRSTSSIKVYLISTVILSLLLVLAFAALPIIGVFYFAKSYDGPHCSSAPTPNVSADK
ncbi:unnamed protein product [Bursaphelenchus xylophilus]|uniref:(pine wood nematode) hypothetical protein n=1 Tax=Bursaphelenchus xylophilus TaxID=6326 RepID=A0A1I7SB40_BURXY|nr:unnamed protein product [Bursaphelenchus xylophilus]CAG9131727.1 unnamed protein product [Bursaphelenchus xylophilus]